MHETNEALKQIKGCGLGLRREHLSEYLESDFLPDFFEVTPENWISMPYHTRQKFEQIIHKRPLIGHSVCLSIGSPEEPDWNFLDDVKKFLDTYNVPIYSDHISFSTWYGSQTYELLPVSWTKSTIRHIQSKAKAIMDFLERPLALENATFYYVPYKEMSEVDFINELLDISDMYMILDVNNVFVNSLNHGFDAREFIENINHDKIFYMHMAGFTRYEDDNIIIDTHGETVKEKVWELLEYTTKFTNAPAIIERDNNIPPLSELESEFRRLESIIKK